MMRWLTDKKRVRSFTCDAAQNGSWAQHYAGIHDIPVDAIVGSVGRSHELCLDFMPAWERRGDERYRRIRAAMLQGRVLPAIEVYQLGDRYYVLDGNHRVAAARAIGQIDIDAIVTEFQPGVAVPNQAAA
jgi:hypothetical protein